MTRDAQRRLEVLQAFTELGAGFSIASHDLEIRGAGNLLGHDQSGTIAEIGFDLYTQLLEEAVAEMRGEPPRVEIEPEVTLPIPALIPDDYVPDVHQRLVLYKRFSGAGSADEVSDLRAELVDRFGELPDEVDALSELMLLKQQMRELRLRAMESGAGSPGGDARAGRAARRGEARGAGAEEQGRVPADAGPQAGGAAGRAGPGGGAARRGEEGAAAISRGARCPEAPCALRTWCAAWCSVAAGRTGAQPRRGCRGTRLFAREARLLHFVDDAPLGLKGRQGDSSMKRVLFLAGLAGALVGCGSGLPSAPALPNFNYGAPSATLSSDQTNVASTRVRAGSALRPA